MRFQTSVFAALSVALLTTALPWTSDDAETEALSSTLPESGQLVFTPLQFGEDELESFDIGTFSDEGVESAIFEDWKTSVVRQHNNYRAQYGAAPLTWSDALYPATVAYAKQCKFQHSNGQGKYGENLAAGTGSSYGFSDGLKDWMDEASKYDYNHPGSSSGTGHFTQVVWKSSKQVACAIADCSAGTIFKQSSKYVICRYTPPGNFVGRYAENVGRHR